MKHAYPTSGLEVLRDMIPASVRKGIYAAYAVAVVLVGVLGIIYGDTSWLDKTEEVILYLGAPVGAIALTNVVPNALVTVEPEPVDPSD